MDLVEDFEFFYRTEFVPAYADVVSFLGDKPVQILVEIENAFAHFIKYFNSDLEKKAKVENIIKAKNHLIRATLDCYKMIWLEINKYLRRIYESHFLRRICTTTEELEFAEDYNIFTSMANDARRIEIDSIGIDPLEALTKYKETMKFGYELMRKGDKYQHGASDLFIKRYLSIDNLIFFIMGLISSAIVAIIL
ncbi:hypothetical protein P0O24_00670 [Methanotrichaceae archaeon M04Ac]|uniref:Uncharacterized protein n=1 Tax=Candidatus Methanocrinis alkalitolerans TaxID=3033395 RepID=A0ABT5XBS2_9EURY|nr:hypothetical protein [Candidatus Methanocrinis alkalitolerans]MDF0592101.1 hypothetical protein [Candidatus Methanocrinis alkalitolerans]